MRILVTGASGFIGHNFCMAALSAGHEILALSRTRQIERHPNYHSQEFDFLTSKPNEINFEKVGAVLHTAWISTPGEYWTSPLNESFEKATLSFAEHLTGLEKPPFLCVSGTCAEYLPSLSPLREDSPLAINSEVPYIRSKLQLHESLAQVYPNLSWARIFYPYGPGEHPSRILSSAIQKLKSNQPFTLNSPHFKKDYIFIDDLSNALLTVIKKQLHGVINIGSGQPTELRTLIEKAKLPISSNSEILSPPDSEHAPIEITVADICKLKSTSWIPKTDLNSGLEKLAKSLD